MPAPRHARNLVLADAAEHHEAADPLVREGDLGEPRAPARERHELRHAASLARDGAGLTPAKDVLDGALHASDRLLDLGVLDALGATRFALPSALRTRLDAPSAVRLELSGDTRLALALSTCRLLGVRLVPSSLRGVGPVRPSLCLDAAIGAPLTRGAVRETRRAARRRLVREGRAKEPQAQAGGDACVVRRRAVREAVQDAPGLHAGERSAGGGRGQTGRSGLRSSGPWPASSRRRVAVGGDQP